MRRSSWLLAVALAWTACLVSARAGAQAVDPNKPPPEPVVPPKANPPLSTPSTFIDREMTRPWSEARTRFFVSARIDGGYLYLKPEFSVGYGKPFSTWAGFDVAPIASSSEVAGYGGFRAVVGPFDFRTGARYNFAFDHEYMPDQPSYSRLDLETTGGKRSTYTAFETVLKGAVRVGPGSIIALANLSYIIGVPSGFDIYEENIHTIVKPPFLWAGRAGYDLHFGSQRQHGIALVGDVLYSPDRDAKTVRAGLLLHFAFSHQFEIRGTFVPTVWSKDGIGLAGDDFSELGLRYRWATGD